VKLLRYIGARAEPNQYDTADKRVRAIVYRFETNKKISVVNVAGQTQFFIVIYAEYQLSLLMAAEDVLSKVKTEPTKK
jgi:hypothetical protein